MRITGTLRSECNFNDDCEKILDTDDPKDVLVQGTVVTDATLLAQARVPQHEALMRMPRALLTDVPGMVLRDAADRRRWFDENHSRDLLRIETLDYYQPDAAEFARWQAGEREPDWVAKQPWLEKIRADRDVGRRRRRIRVVRGPLSEYVRYTCQWGYIPLAESGEEIRILDLRDGSSGVGRTGDFAVLDDAHVALMHYDENGGVIGAEIVTRFVEYFVALRDLMWLAAEPFSTWWARHPEFHRGDAYAG